MMKSSLLHPRYWLNWIGIGLLALLGHLPYRWLPWVGKGMGLLLMKIAKSRVKVTRVNLALCFPEKSESERELLVKEVFVSAGYGIMETLIAWFYPARRFNRIPIQVEGLECLISNEQGVLILFPHLSLLELAGRAVGEKILISDVYQHASSPIFNYVMLKRRHRYFDHLINRENLRDFIRSLAAKEKVAYLPDQDFGRRNSVFVPFFGVPTATATSTARVSTMTSARVVIGNALRLKTPTGFAYKITFKPIDAFPTGDEVVDATRINYELEQAILEQPENYFWYHKRFKTRPEGMAGVY